MSEPGIADVHILVEFDDGNEIRYLGRLLEFETDIELDPDPVDSDRIHQQLKESGERTILMKTVDKAHNSNPTEDHEQERQSD